MGTHGFGGSDAQQAQGGILRGLGVGLQDPCGSLPSWDILGFPVLSPWTSKCYKEVGTQGQDTGTTPEPGKPGCREGNGLKVTVLP